MGKKEKRTESPIREKRYSLLKEEKEKIEYIYSILGIHTLTVEALRNQLTMETFRAKTRLNIGNKSEDGWDRSVDFDPITYELVVKDIKVQKSANESKN
jgi:hypothetical protein